MSLKPSDLPATPKMGQRALLEIDLTQLERNFQLVLQDKPKHLQFMAVSKNKGCGMGIIPFSKLAMRYGASCLAVANLEEALELEKLGAPLLILGERSEAELELLVEKGFQLQMQDATLAKRLNALAHQRNRQVSIHYKIDTGLHRYGAPLNQATSLYSQLLELKNLKIVGIMSHFASSDEWDKSYAYFQWNNFLHALTNLKLSEPRPLLHICNSGGYLDLPYFHLDACRLGVLFTGVYPSKVCRRIKIGGEGLENPLRLVSRIAFIKQLDAGDQVGYGMHFTASGPTQIAVIPLGYGDGFPRLRNQGHVLIRGQEAPIVGGVAMDSFMVDISKIKGAAIDDKVVLIGRQGEKELTPVYWSDLTKTVVYQILTAWQPRLKTVYLNAPDR